MEKQNRNIFVIAGGAILLVLAFVIKGIPVLIGIIASFKDYSPLSGLFGSPYVGFLNLSVTLSDPNFWRVLVNTIKMNLLYLAVVMAFAVPLAFSLMNLNRRFQKILITILLVPLFIPGSAIAHVSFTWFKDTTILSRAGLFPFIYAFLLAMKNMGLPTLFILKTGHMQKGSMQRNAFGRLRAPLVFVLVQAAFLFSSNFDILQSLLNPLVYQTGDTLDHFIYRMGFMQMNMGTALSAWLIQLIAQLVIGLAVYVLLRLIAKEPQDAAMPDSEISDPEKTEAQNPAGFILPLIFTLFLAWFVYRPLLVDGIIGLTGNGMMRIDQMMMPYIRYIFIYGLVALIGVPISVVLAKCARIRGGVGEIFRVILILMLISAGMGIHQYLFMRTLGLFNTVFSIMLYYLFPFASSLVLAAILAYREKSVNENETAESFCIWKPAFALGLLHFITMWNSEYVPLAFISRQEMMPPILLSRIASQGMGAEGMDMGAILGMDLLVTILPVALFLIFRRHITEWILLVYTRIRQ